MSIHSLAMAIKYLVDQRIKAEARALRGNIENGRFISGGKSYPFTQAVDCSTSNRVWAQLSTNGKAVIVGA